MVARRASEGARAIKYTRPLTCVSGLPKEKPRFIRSGVGDVQSCLLLTWQQASERQLLVQQESAWQERHRSWSSQRERCGNPCRNRSSCGRGS